MHIDANALDDGSLIEGDLCIVGAGAAGISMALEWDGSGHDVVLLEGGGFEVDADMQDLYRGENIGRKYYPLQSSRLHFFGGTTGHWAGFCTRFDWWDFVEREWVPHSGWPFGLEEIEPFYERAQKLVELGPSEAWNVAYWATQDPALAPLPFDPARVWTKIWQFSPPTRFGTRYRDPILGSSNIQLYTHANVCEIAANEGVSQVEELEIRCLNGKRHRVRARAYVLASGAIQNARLLLASNRQASGGLGNDHDLVGRYFMEHVEAPSAFLVLMDPGPAPLYRFDHEAFIKRRARGELALTYEQQQKERVLNCSADLQAQADMIVDAHTNRIDIYPQAADEVIAWMNGLMDALAREDRGGAAEPVQIAGFTMQCRSETAPNPDSRIMLDEETDALGVPRVMLNWQLTDLDLHTLQRTFEVLGEEAGRLGLGRIRIHDWLLQDDPFGSPTSPVAAGWHHMGTTRMHADPREGVVDPNGKVHGLANLYVAGSSVFPTSGSANPTLTLVALTLRLSDHLKNALG